MVVVEVTVVGRDLGSCNCGLGGPCAAGRCGTAAAATEGGLWRRLVDSGDVVVIDGFGMWVYQK